MFEQEIFVVWHMHECQLVAALFICVHFERIQH